MYRTLIKLFAFALLATLHGSAYVGLNQLGGPGRINFSVASDSIVPNKPHRFKIRTITAGVNLKNTTDVVTIESAIEFLQREKKIFEDEGYEI